MALRILIVKIGSIGDVVYSMPMLGAIHEALPDAHVSWLVGQSSADILRGHPRLQKLFIIDDKMLYSGGIMNRLSVFKDVFGQLNRGYDLILIGHRDPGYSFALRPFVWGPFFQISHDETSSQVRHVVHIPPMSMHESLAMRKLLGTGLKYLKKSLKYTWYEPFQHIGDPPGRLPEKFAVFHICGGANAKNEFRLKQWPQTLDLMQSLLRETDLSIVILGTKEDRADFDGKFRPLQSIDDKRIHNWMGETSLRESVGIIRRAKVFIGPDSGPLHIADSLGVRTIGVFGPTSPVSWGLLGTMSRSVVNQVPCSPCYKDSGVFPPCPNQHQCMTGLSLDSVKKEVFDLLKAQIQLPPAL